MKLVKVQKNKHIYSVSLIDCKNVSEKAESLFQLGCFCQSKNNVADTVLRELLQCGSKLKQGLVFSVPVDVHFCASSFMSDCHRRPAGSSVGSRQCGAKCPAVSIAVKPH